MERLISEICHERDVYQFENLEGMLLCLSGHSRPDITYAANCCVRYIFSPRFSHGKALKRIGRYLKITRDHRLVMRPSGELKVDAYPGADFSELYGHKKSSDPACAKSRAGFVINVANCPVILISRLMRETALSTMEADINPLSLCCRKLLPLMDMVGEVGEAVGMATKDMTSMHVSVHEDNADTLVLAKTLPPQYNPLVPAQKNRLG